MDRRRVLGGGRLIARRDGAVARWPLLIALLVGACAAPEASPSTTPGSRDTATATPRPPTTPTPTEDPTPSPTPSSPPPTPGTYLALGDSLAVGVGASEPGRLGYVGRLHAAVRHLGELRNLAVSGETSTSMIRGGQLLAALGAIEAEPPALVTLDIGGNDLLRLIGTAPCTTSPESTECLTLVALTLEDYERNLRQILGELRGALDEHAPDARIALMTYFNPFSGTDAAYESAGELALLGSDGRLDCKTDDRAARGMNDIIACLAEEHDAIAVDVHPRFVDLGLELTHIGSQDIHANDRGYEVIAETFLEALNR